MNKLLSAEFPRLFKSKIMYISLILSTFIGIASVLTLFTSGEELPEMMMLAQSSNNTFMFLTMMMPIFSGGVGIILTANEFSSGIIRNKLIMGHGRQSIYLSWVIVYTVHTVLSFIAYFGGYFIAAAVGGLDLSLLKASTVAADLAILFCFMYKFMLFCMMLTMILPDQKTSIISYMLNSVAALPVTMLGMSDADSGAVKVLSRFFIYGFTFSENSSFLTSIEKPWLTMICTLGLGIIYTIGGYYLFKKKEIK